ncbi:penicillin-binding protein 2 [Gleimia sp. 6138-11-ORH1]|uniref:peptidoglycan D,D-transpeptidase FtsI family protein n=1 Tax=Gleimia sp. 6138-11-ORH1 TaxID=2973937 RepID=UPI002167FBD2|nr:penicillin-binding protein 2 [Gleimia sp. 6138-11-ORH1]MCS4484544.1 penicillin-binding protein 2 [Gleimia sp. 6138-11-ORH1]
MQGPHLAEIAANSRLGTTNLPAQRGDIVDAKGTVLATTIQTYDIAVNQRLILEAIWHETNEEGEIVQTKRGPGMVAEFLAPILGMDEAELGGKMVGNSTYVILAKDVEVATWRKIRNLRFRGIEWEAKTKRIYPAEETAASVIGFVTREGTGNGGIELSQEENLKGTDGKVTNEYSRYGQVLPSQFAELTEPINGKSVHLTLDIDLQHRIEDLVNETAKRNNAQAASVVITDLKTGNILVLADAYNQPIGTTPQASKVVQYAAEPGSVGKVFTMAAALEHNVITALTPVPAPDIFVAPNGERFKDAEPHGYQVLTAAGVLANSSNTGTVFIGSKISDQQRYEVMQRLGLGKPTEVGLPGESAGFLPPPDTWDGRQKYVNMFGQAYSVNQLQLVNAFATIGNGGTYLPLRLVDGYTLPDGSYEQVPYEQAQKALRPEVAAELMKMMETVSVSGSGQHFQVPGYRTALKTGTAEIFENGRYVGNSLNITGVVPAQDPQLAIAVHMYRPATNNYATVLLADLFKSVVTEAVRARNIPASDSQPQTYPVYAN